MRPMVLMTESILPLRTCFAALNVKPFTCEAERAMASQGERIPPRHPRRRGRPCTQEPPQARPHVARFLDADSFCAHRFGNLAKLGSLEVHAEGDDAGLLLFDLDEVKSIVVEDDLNDWSSSFHLRQEIAKGKHRVAAVATESNRLRLDMQLCAEALGEALPWMPRRTSRKVSDPCRH